MTGRIDPSAEQADRVLDAVPAAVGLWDRQMRNVVANAALRHLLGVDDAHGRTIADLVGTDVFDRERPHLEAALAGERQDYTRTVVDPDGRTRHVHITLTPDVVDGAVTGVVGHVIDVPSEAALDSQRDEALGLLVKTLEFSPVATAVMTTTDRWIDVNRAMCALLGYTTAEMLEMSFASVAHPDDLEVSLAEREALLSGTTSHVESEARLIRRDGSSVWVHRHATIVRAATAAGEDIVIAQVHDITERRSLERALTRQALTDPLTGLGNRRRFMGLVSELAEQDERQVGLIYLDLDDFKRVNDTHGHSVGDELLVAVADRIGSVIGVHDTVCRIGGDEFVVLVRSARTADDLDGQRIRLKTVLSEPYTLTSTATPVRVSVSAGSSWSGDDPAALLRVADEQMYRDKSARPR
ncbi:diguanylate cyclase domain-containing protein [Williamsia serinedens]|uniref:PAS domain S-box-containing protein/diguanylate cyclase (GGDEF) domain-containing protein n=1 Tax=Williamsia serinedens TaxID=391736 RepID=A0ABT1H134_9NOCA|nr:diguanylate cyclase [Williamsia serinedens]MCP2160954.1 PAS domain S-box-containing protein/diguanylate cyclase (GGDEF) domain-containing protein [Williamsia serinedens]